MPQSNQAKILYHVIDGAMVCGMRRKPLFRSNNRPIMAVTWPFSDRSLLETVAKLLRPLGYEAYIHQRPGYEYFELIIGAADGTKDSRRKEN